MLRKGLALGALHVMLMSAALAATNTSWCLYEDQLRDNLTLRLNAGQLKIDQEATFRVYLINTMDRQLNDARLAVLSNEFEATVKPSPTWKNAPDLETIRKGGKKEYYEVTLRRKKGVPDGRYKVELQLLSSRHNEPRRAILTTLDRVADVCTLPAAAKIGIDGQADAAEWSGGYLCTDFYVYRTGPRVYQGLANMPPVNASRFRLAADADNIYCLMNFHGGQDAAGDQATVYLSAKDEGEPVTVAIDRISGAVSGSKGTEGVECKVSADRQLVELRIPRRLAGLQGAKTFRANFAREVKPKDPKGKPELSYWRGNEFTLKDPVVYGLFTTE